jgi:hypothetical protein
MAATSGHPQFRRALVQGYRTIAVRVAINPEIRWEFLTAPSAADSFV